MNVTPKGFGLLTASLMARAERTAAGRLAMVLEGGYDPAALRDGVGEVLRALARGTIPSGDSPSLRPPEAGGPLPDEGSPLLGALSASLRAELEEPLQTFRKKWDIPSA
jgi:hypothetical protein